VLNTTTPVKYYDHSVDAEMTVSNSKFQICEAATGKARPLMVDSLK